MSGSNVTPQGDLSGFNLAQKDLFENISKTANADDILDEIFEANVWQGSEFSTSRIPGLRNKETRAAIVNLYYVATSEDPQAALSGIYETNDDVNMKKEAAYKDFSNLIMTGSDEAISDIWAQMAQTLNDAKMPDVDFLSDGSFANAQPQFKFITESFEALGKTMPEGAGAKLGEDNLEDFNNNRGFIEELSTLLNSIWVKLSQALDPSANLDMRNRLGDKVPGSGLVDVEKEYLIEQGSKKRANEHITLNNASERDITDATVGYMSAIEHSVRFRDRVDAKLVSDVVKASYEEQMEIEVLGEDTVSLREEVTLEDFNKSVLKNRKEIKTTQPAREADRKKAAVKSGHNLQ